MVCPVPDLLFKVTVAFSALPTAVLAFSVVPKEAILLAPPLHATVPPLVRALNVEVDPDV